MLDKYKVLQCLENKKEEFQYFNQNNSDDLNKLRKSFEKMHNISEEQIAKKLLETETPGALPSKEWDENCPVVKFHTRWHNHQDSRQWAHNILLNRPTFSVDGSQILPSKDFSPPVAAVQVSKFENLHTSCGQYTKDIEFDIISPKELNDKEQEFSTIDHYVNFKRFELEIDTIIDYIQNKAFQEVKPVVFFDGSLIISFITAEGATGRNKQLRDDYINKICLLLQTSETCKVPLIGFIDNSGAYDIVDMIKNYNNLTLNTTVTDPQIYNKYLKWGDRSVVFQSKRPGVLSDYGLFEDKIYFTYLKTCRNMPARLEFPQWLYENTTLFEEVLDIIRAETIAGSGYIYSIESADATAVITNRDKQLFYRIFSDFSVKYNLGFNVAKKLVSKWNRR